MIVKKYDFLFALIIGILVLLEYFFLYSIDTNILKYQCLILDVVVIVISINKFEKICHPYIILLFMINLFLCSRIWIEYYIDYPFYYTTFLSSYPFSDITQHNILYMLILTFTGLNIGVNITVLKNNKTIEVDKFILLRTLCKKVMIAFIPFVLYDTYQTYNLVSEYGYAILYMNQAGIEIENNGIFHYFKVLFMCVFFMFLASKPKKKEFIMYSAIYFLVMITTLFLGTRGGLGAIFLLLLTYANMFYFKIKIKNICIAVLIMISLFQLVAQTRNLNKEERNQFEIMSQVDPDIYIEFLRQQGVSITVLGYADMMNDGTINDIVYPVTSMILGYIDNDYNVNKKEKINFPDKITNFVNPTLYRKGLGAGSSYIAELYSYGGFLIVFLVNILLGWFIVYSAKRYKFCFWGRFFLLIFWYNLYVMPRGSLLGFMPNLIKWCGVAAVILYLIRFKKID